MAVNFIMVELTALNWLLVYALALEDYPLAFKGSKVTLKLLKLMAVFIVVNAI